MWHSTEKMARAVAEGFAQRGIPVSFYDIKENHMSDIVTDLMTAKYLAVGSPTINNQMMPTIAAFLCYLKGLAPKGKKAFAFGSYGWGGQSIGQVEEELKACGCEIVLDKIRVANVPSDEDLAAIAAKMNF
jgi:flavorubredoxin